MYSIFKKKSLYTIEKSNNEFKDISLAYNNITKLNNIKKKISDLYISDYLDVSVAETLTAGAVSNLLCNKPGSSSFFNGGIIAYNMEIQKNILGVDADYAEKNNFANPYTTYIMAQNIAKKFKSRIGISNTGFSLPTQRNEELDANNNIVKCRIDVKVPYAYICIYDDLTSYHKIYLLKNEDYDIYSKQKIQRANMQFLVAKKTKEIYIDYCRYINKNN